MHRLVSFMPECPNADDLRATLVSERSATERRVASLQREFDGIVEAATDVATDDEHDPEGATIAFERSATSALIDQARRHAAEIARALHRLDDGTYGDCERCGQPIGDERLEARPTATTCITCATGRH